MTTIEFIKYLTNKSKNNKYFYMFNCLASGYQYSKLYNIVDSLNVHNKIILDWGAHSGHFTYFLLKKGAEVTAFCKKKDFQFFQELQNNCNFNFMDTDLSDPSSLPFHKDTFDIIFSIGVLEHVKETNGNELSSLCEIKRILKYNGQFLCYHFPNKYSLSSYISKILGKDTHKYTYTRKEIINLVNQSGLVLEKLARYGFLPKNILSNLPCFLSNNYFFIKCYYFLDDILTLIFPFFVQNFLFIAKKI